jgi:hypothetical protein
MPVFAVIGTPRMHSKGRSYNATWWCLILNAFSPTCQLTSRDYSNGTKKKRSLGKVTRVNRLRREANEILERLLLSHLASSKGVPDTCTFFSFFLSRVSVWFFRDLAYCSGVGHVWTRASLTSVSCTFLG